MIGALVRKTNYIALSILLLVLNSGVKGQTGEELAAIYQSTLTQYDVFPPIDPDPSIWEDESIRPIEVIVGNTILSIDSIDPGSSRFTATNRFFIYWKKSDCNQTQAHSAACGSSESAIDLPFLYSKSSIGSSNVKLRQKIEDVHQTVFEENGQSDIQPDVELMEGQTTFAQVRLMV